MNNSFNFWYKWLLIVSISFVMIGIIIAVGSNTALFDLHSAALSEVFFKTELTEEANKLRSFLFAPIGGTIAGYFLLQSFIVWKPFYRREPWAWYAILYSLILWFLVDSGMSIYHGAFFNVWMVNIWTVLMIGLPLWMTRHEFIKSNL